MTKKERSNVEDSVVQIRNLVYDMQAEKSFNDELLPYCRKMVREIDKLLYVLKQ